MKIPGKDGIDYVNIGPSHKTNIGRLLNLGTEMWFTTPHGRCLTLIGYHYFNTIRHAIEESPSEASSELRRCMNTILQAQNNDAKARYNQCLKLFEQQYGYRPKGLRYPSDWQTPSIYARLSMLSNPIDEFYNCNLPIVWLDADGNDLCDGRSRIGYYVETILRLRNDHAKYHDYSQK